MLSSTAPLLTHAGAAAAATLVQSSADVPPHWQDSQAFALAPYPAPASLDSSHPPLNHWPRSHHLLHHHTELSSYSKVATTIRMPSLSGTITPAHSGIEIHLDSPDLVLRSIVGNEQDGQPAELKGHVELVLAESTHMKDVTLVLRAAAKINTTDATHHKRQPVDHALFYHDISFLAPTNTTAPSSSSWHHQHTHTLAAGRHKFPFQVSLPATLPASLRTFAGSALIYYKLKAVGTRASGFLHHGKWEAERLLRVARSFVPDAVEWSQTLEIDNTWPGKIAYEITIPHKAYAAGQSIPVRLKFTPLVKGVHVASITTALKEHVRLHYKSGSMLTEARDVSISKHDFVKVGSSGPVEAIARSNPHSTSCVTSHDQVVTPNDSGLDASSLPARLHATSSTAHVGAVRAALSTVTSGFSTPISRVPSSPRVLGSVDLPSHLHQSDAAPSRSTSSSRLAESFSSPENAMAYISERLDGQHLDSTTLEEIRQDVELSENIDTVIEIPIPAWTTPTHGLSPVQVSHKVTWSVFIQNVDGHTSELRCGLPIYILAPHLLEEVRLATSGVRNLLFGPSGALVANSELQATDLPSYQEHVRDRIASIVDISAIYPVPSDAITNPWSMGIESALATPTHSPPPSRPSSPGPGSLSGTRSPGAAPLSTNHPQTGAQVSHGEGYFASQASRSGTSMTVNGVLSNTGAGMGYGDLECDTMASIHGGGVLEPSTSRSSSGPHSRPASRPNSGRSTPVPVPSPDSSLATGSNGHGHIGSTASSLLRHLPKPLRTLTPMNKSPTNTPCTGEPPHSSVSAITSGMVAGSMTPITSNTPPQSHVSSMAAHSASLQARLASLALSGRDSHVPAHPHNDGHQAAHGETELVTVTDDLELLNRVPSYRIASQGPLGGGQVPLSSFVGLPSYDDSERSAHVTSSLDST